MLPSPSGSGIDFAEPIPRVIERLKAEHRTLKLKSDEIVAACESNPQSAISMLQGVRKQILHHSVEEEARVIRVIFQHLKPESAESVRIMQEHRWVVEFLERRLTVLPTLPGDQAGKEILKFLRDLGSHFDEEEREVFPLALRASQM